jgi:hypothetical protein
VVKGNEVLPLLVAGAVTVEFSVFTHVMPSATAEKSYIRTIICCPSFGVGDVTPSVMVIAAAEEFVNVLRKNDWDAVPAFVVTVIAWLFGAIKSAVLTPVVALVVIAGLVSVLLVRVSVVARATRVSVAAGNVRAFEPDTAGTAKVRVPDVAPAIENAPAVVPAVPRVRRADGELVPIPTFPFNNVCVTLVFPSTISLLCVTCAPFPIAVEFVTPSTLELAPYPRKVLLDMVWSATPPLYPAS